MAFWFSLYNLSLFFNILIANLIHHCHKYSNLEQVNCYGSDFQLAVQRDLSAGCTPVGLRVLSAGCTPVGLRVLSAGCTPVGLRILSAGCTPVGLQVLAAEYTAVGLRVLFSPNFKLDYEENQPSKEHVKNLIRNSYIKK